MENKEKTRHQTIYEFLECLQLEYVNLELRKKIYPFANDKKYYKRTMEFKKQKIVDIATRNRLSTIFDDEQVKAKIYNQCIPQWGLPIFIYQSEDDYNNQRHWDIINYFAVGSEVKILMDDNSIAIGTIISADHLTPFSSVSVVTVKLRDDNRSYIKLWNQVSRIL